MGNKRKKNNRQQQQQQQQKGAVDDGSGSPNSLIDTRNTKKNRTDQSWDQGTNAKQWADIVTRNELFENYYKKMGILKTDEEWKLFMDTMGKQLPTTFRINTTIGQLTQVVLDQLQAVIKALPKEVEVEGTVYSLPTEIPWYPNHLGWHSPVPKRAFRKNPVLSDFQKFLVHHDEQGNLTRQEAVSMIPPVFLEVQPNHMVLDMCAAPGSKTTQIIEALHQGVPKDTLPKGLIIANDVDTSRCYMLVHQTARLGTPCIVVTNHEAQNFPLLTLDQDDGSKLPLQFDRILADVPCSGDGTLRKNPDLWQRWTVMAGANLHKLQVSIATRAANLLKVGGRMVYSTCSLNPLENEAVVMELIRRAEGSIRVVDVSAQHPELIRANGMYTWPVIDREGECFAKWDDVPPMKKAKIPQTFFPPTEEAARAAGLQHCMRVYPHFQDTGGFFITVLEKVADMPKQIGKRFLDGTASAAPTTSTTTTTTTSDAPTSPQQESVDSPTTAEPAAEEKKKNNPYVRFNEEPFILLTEENLKEVDMAVQFYGLKPTFPIANLLTRSEKMGKLYLASDPIVELVKGDKTRRLKIINAGLKAFQKHDGLGMMTCPYRISQDAVSWVQPFMTKRVLQLSHDDLVHIVKVSEPMFTEFPKELEERLEALDPGCFVITVDGSDQDQSRGMRFCVWRGKKSIHLLVPKQEVQSLANILKITIEKPKNHRVKEATGVLEEEADTTTTTTTTTSTVNIDVLKTNSS
ncbi:hypothetical protein SAMD00019534_019930 [Acytostelium subglobosum LB1]|uniref:hypothetical protein n=1 Tax=Acytostelium subglobosum LB1 TaxID=1410327 RepID=UPI000644E25D|nr:hypothetical protein SAMD00019534_019930 [Acytostelium subglobosum LB1]GAM18818.1 hypothetical protein SAMD00019534_019930 [Acytostelium subglobosum LB1]|eukprot:XP_012758038.1 hypothetical protein SAMD00019534_019930 [Acytostelium subglobosum LB1]